MADLLDYDKILGRVVSHAELNAADEVIIKFSDGVALVLRDAGQSCCERRYITTDDDLSVLVGGAIVSIVAKPGPDVKGEDTYGDHNIMFIEIQGSRGFVTLTTHNEHNGYYGGFDLQAKFHDPTPAPEAYVPVGEDKVLGFTAPLELLDEFSRSTAGMKKATAAAIMSGPPFKPNGRHKGNRKLKKGALSRFKLPK